MAHAWRIEFEGALYHVLARAMRGRTFLSIMIDRKLFLASVGDMSERYRIDIFAYVLMNNHYHWWTYLQEAGQVIYQLKDATKTNVFDALEWIVAMRLRRKILCYLLSDDKVNHVIRVSVDVNRGKISIEYTGDAAHRHSNLE